MSNEENGEQLGCVDVPQNMRAALGLGLCSIDALLNPEERAELERDISKLRQARVTDVTDLKIFLA